MRSEQFELCLATLRRLQKSGVLQELVLIGSWCLPVYGAYFRGVGQIYAVKTRDMDFLVPPTAKFRGTVHIPDLLKDLGFITGFHGDKGYMFLQHPELMIEFLTPERGRGSDKPKDLPALGMNAQPLRFLDMLLEDPMHLRFDSIPVTVPQPAAFSLQKLLVAPRRKGAEKRAKDIATAVTILGLIDKKGEWASVQRVLSRFPKSWKRMVLKVLTEADHAELAQRLRG